jgi:hypothetical protein
VRKNSENFVGVLDINLEMVNESDLCEDELEDKEDKKKGQLFSFADRTEQDDEEYEQINMTGNSQPDQRLLE